MFGGVITFVRSMPPSCQERLACGEGIRWDDNPSHGEFVITANGVEGGIVYMVSASVRDMIAVDGMATVWLDLAPDRTVKLLEHDLSRPRGKRTVATHLKRYAGITGVKAGLPRGCAERSISRPCSFGRCGEISSADARCSQAAGRSHQYGWWPLV